MADDGGYDMVKLDDSSTEFADIKKLFESSMGGTKTTIKKVSDAAIQFINISVDIIMYQRFYTDFKNTKSEHLPELCV